MIVGAGPAGLFAAFQIGLFGLSRIVIDCGAEVGGQLIALYADKPIHDAPGFPSVLARDLIERLVTQSGLSDEDLVLGLRVAAVDVSADNGAFRSTLANGHIVASRAVILACGGGALENGPSILGNASEEPVTVDPATFETAQAGLFSIGDNAIYPGKLRLILSAFHESALSTQAIRRRLGNGVAAGSVRAGGRGGRRQAK